MTQNIYDDPAFFEGYSRLGRSLQGLAGAPEWPALQAMLPPLRDQVEGPRSTNWLAEGVIKQHRTIGTLRNLLIAGGFTICHVEEWGPSAEQLLARPELEEERDRPMMLLVAARR
jgi:hypothetical protein